MKTKSLALIFAAFLSFPAVACGEGEGDKSASDSSGTASANPYATATNLFEDGKYYLGDFESFDQCVQYWAGSGIRTEMCTDEEFVKHGEASLKVSVENEIRGWHAPRESPFLTISCTGEYFQKTDFTDCESFTMEIYNAQDYNVIIWFNFTAKWTCGNARQVAPGWNTFEIRAEDCVYDPETKESYLGEISYIAIGFPSYETYNEEQVYYIDSVVAHKKG